MSKEIFIFKILHDGWEMDNEGWIIEHRDGRKELKTTNSGGECDMSLVALEKKIIETQDSLNGLIKAREMISENNIDCS